MKAFIDEHRDFYGGEPIRKVLPIIPSTYQAYAAFVLDALEQALHERRPLQGSCLMHHSDRG